jgi:predicted HNH restriction endonuclease
MEKVTVMIVSLSGSHGCEYEDNSLHHDVSYDEGKISLIRQSTYETTRRSIPENVNFNDSVHCALLCCDTV